MLRAVEAIPTLAMDSAPSRQAARQRRCLCLALTCTLMSPLVIPGTSATICSSLSVSFTSTARLQGGPTVGCTEAGLQWEQGG